MMITSVSNPRIKEVRKLRDRKEQKRTGLYYMEGLRIVGEAFAKKAPLTTVIICPDRLKAEFGLSLWQQMKDSGIEILEVSSEVFDSLALKDNPQGIAAIAEARYCGLDDIPTDRGIIVALTEPADPGNLGTIIRTADAVDARGIILLGDCTSPYDAGAIRASMGAIFSTRIVRTDFESLLAWKKAHGLQLVGTSDHAARDYVEIEYDDPMILLMGSEREGMSAREEECCDEIARIPMMRSSDSLNLAVATGVMLYEVFNHQRRAK